MQYAFSYFYYLMGVHEAVTPEDVFDEMDTDKSRYHTLQCTFLLRGSYEGRAKSSVTNRLPWFYPKYILK